MDKLNRFAKRIEHMQTNLEPVFAMELFLHWKYLYNTTKRAKIFILPNNYYALYYRSKYNFCKIGTGVCRR